MNTTTLQKRVKELFAEQTTHWPLAKKNFDALQQVQSKTLHLNGYQVQVQFNPARMVSSGAKVDTKSIQERKCFLCAHHLPAEQKGIAWRNYTILVNPFPIFPEHFTIPHKEHRGQAILPHIEDMLALAEELPEYLIFYNGPLCGASAPDHMHFQAGTKNFLPLINQLQKGEKSDRYPTLFEITGSNTYELLQAFTHHYHELRGESTEEPMMNVVCSFKNGKWYLYILPRLAFRPWQYSAQPDKQLLISPATVEMCGVFITPVEEHFNRVSKEDLIDIIKQVSLPYRQERQRQIPTISVGIVVSPTLVFQLKGAYRCVQTDTLAGDSFLCSVVENRLCIDHKTYTELLFMPSSNNDSFEIEDVVIGIDFHWERKERQRFNGALKLIVESGAVRAINIIDMERYLESVISSEMSATSSMELLKAHAVISRSWAVAPTTGREGSPTELHSANTHTKWYERSAHSAFDVCADDHCQRYQGVTRATTAAIKEAVEATAGEVLAYENEICDARFSKCCGGASESFHNCWAEEHHPYLTPIRDNPLGELPDLTCEEEAEKWIRSQPEAFCNTTDKRVLEQVLNNYDQETTDFYRWRVRYTQQELSELVSRRSGIDFGLITDLIPIQRGASGRLVRLKIVGTKRTLTIGKELEIRKWLSESHLYSSAFVVEKDQRYHFTLIGAGWGHGVGLCQIGAAMMSAKGYGYTAILQHYFKGAAIQKKW